MKTRKLCANISKLLKNRLVLIIAGVMLYCSGVWGQTTYTWTGAGGDTDWDTTTNWTPNGTPGSSDTVIINGTQTITMPNSDIVIDSLNIATTGDSSISFVTQSDKKFSITNTTTLNKFKDTAPGQTYSAILNIEGTGTFSTQYVDMPETFWGKEFSINIDKNATLEITGQIYANIGNTSQFTISGSGTYCPPPSEYNGNKQEISEDVVQKKVNGVWTLSSHALQLGTTTTVEISNSVTQFNKVYAEILIINTDATTTEEYKINGSAISASSDIDLGSDKNTHTLSISIPATVDSGDVITIDFYADDTKTQKIGNTLFFRGSTPPTTTSTWTGIWDTTPSSTTKNIIIVTNLTIDDSNLKIDFSTNYPALTKLTVRDTATLTSSADTNFNNIQIINNGTIELTGSETYIDTSKNTNGSGTNSTIVYTSTATPLWGTKYNNLTVSSSADLTISNDITVNTKLKNEGTISNGANINIQGAFEDSGTWSGTGKIIFNGTTNQTFTPESGTTYPEIEENKTDGTLTVASALSANTITLTKGTETTFSGAVTSTTFSDAAAAGNINFNAGGTISSATTFNTTGDVTFSGATVLDFGSNTVTHTAGKTILKGKIKTSKLTIGNASLDGNSEIDGALDFAGGTDAAHRNSIARTTGTLKVSGDITVVSSAFYTLGTSAITIEPITAGSTITFTNSGDLTIPHSTKITANFINSGTLSAGGSATDSDCRINGSFTNSGSITIPAGKYFSVTGTVDDSAGTSWNDTGTLQFTGTTDQSFNNKTNRTYSSVNAKLTAGKTVTVSDPLTITNFTLTSGNVDFSGSVTIGTYSETNTPPSDLTFSAGGTIKSTTTMATTGTVTIPASQTLVFSDAAATPAYYDFTHTAGTTTINGELIAKNITVGDVTSDGKITVKGDFTDQGTFTASTNSQIILDGTINQEFKAGTGTYKKIEVNKNSGETTFNTNTLSTDTLDITQSANVDFATSVLITTLTAAATSGDINFNAGGTISSSVAFATTGTVQFGDADSDSITFGANTVIHTAGNTKIAGNLTASEVSVNDLTLLSNSTITTTTADGLKLSGGADASHKNLLTGNFTLTSAGNITTSAFYEINAARVTFSPVSKTLTNNGDLYLASTTITGELSNSTSKNLTISYTTTLNGNFTNDGIFKIDSGKTFSLSKNFTNNGSVSAGNNSTFEITDDSIIGGTSFAVSNFKADNLGNKTITLNTDVTVNGTLTLKGTAPVAGPPAIVASYLTVTDDGTGKGFILSASQPANITDNAVGSYLKIGPTVKIKTPPVAPAVIPTSDGITGRFYKASDSVPSVSTANADYATVINNGWRIKELSDLTYTWTGAAVSPASNTDWAVRSNWDIGIVPGVTTAGQAKSSGATVIIPDGIASYPELNTTSYTLKALTIGSSPTATPAATLSLAGSGNLVISPVAATDKLTNYSQIIYSSSGRIVDNDDTPINDSAKGSVEYKTATGTIADVDYYDLKITSGDWSNTSGKTITVNNTLSVTGTPNNPTINFAKGLTVKGGNISIPAGVNLTLGGTIKSISDGASPTSYTQTYDTPVFLSANADLDFQGSSVTFKDTVNGGVIFKISGNGEINGDIGGTTAPSSIEVTGTTKINTASINSSGNQTYTGAVTIGEQDTTFTSTSGTVNFASTLTGTSTVVAGPPSTTTYHDVKIDGQAEFHGNVSDFNKLSLTKDTEIKTSNLKLNIPVEIENDLSISGSSVEFKNIISGIGKQLTLETTASFSAPAEITANILNKGTINVPTVSPAGTPLVPQTAISFKGTYTANDTTQPGSLLGSSTTDPYIDFYKDATFGNFTANNDTVRFVETSAKHFNPNSQIFADVIFDNGTTTIQEDITADNLTINSSGILIATDNKTITINKNWTNTPGATGFTSNKSTIKFDSTNDSTITGDSTFYNLTCEKEGKTLTFEAGSTQSISNKLTITGKVDQFIKLRSSTSRSQWNIKCIKAHSAVDPAFDISYADVQDSNNTSPYRLTAENSADSGNNNRWNFTGVTYTWTGNANSDWFNQSNWDKGSVPGIGVNAIIHAVASPAVYPVLERDLENQNSFTEYASIGNTGTITVDSGAILDFNNFSLTADSITNNGRIRLEGSQVISSNSIRNNTNSIVEYYGNCSTSQMLDNTNSSNYYNLEFANGAFGTITDNIIIANTTLITNGTGNNLILSGNNTFAAPVTIGQLSPAPSAGIITINSADNITLTDNTLADSLAITAPDKTILLQGNLTTTDNCNLTGATIRTIGGVSGAPAIITVTGTNGLTISGNYENTGFITDNSITSINGNLVNINEFTNNSSIYLTGNLTDTNGKWTENAGIIIFNGNTSQSFNTNPATTYYDVQINKTAGDFDITAALKLQTINIQLCENTKFDSDALIQTIKTNASSGNIIFTGNTDISTDTIFSNTGLLQLGADSGTPNQSTSVTTLGSNPVLKDISHTAGPTTIYGTLNSADASFAQLDCKSDIIVNCANLNLNGDVSTTAAYLKINGNLTSTNQITISPDIMLNGNYSGDGNATLQNSLYIFPSAGLSPITIDDITILKNLIFDSPVQITTNGTIKADNIVLYNGTITASPDSSLQSTSDLLLLGSQYNISNPESGNSSEFIYQQQRLSPWNYLRADFASSATNLDKFPDGTPLSSTTNGFNGEYSALAGASLKAGKNFYANGISLTGASEWFIDIPDVTNANNGFAETSYSTIKNSTIRLLSDLSDDGAKAKMPAYFSTDNGNNKNWLFDNFEIFEAHTVRDDCIEINFNRPLRNNNSELIDSIFRFKNNTDTFQGFYTDPDCQNPLTAENITSGRIYLKAPDSWNTDATGKSSGDDEATDRAGIHKNIIPYIQIQSLASNSSTHISDIWGKRIQNYDDSNRFTDVSDRTGPVLYSVRTGQELHTNYNYATGAESQPSYDSHNFIEFRYSEKVNFGDSSLDSNPASVFDNSDLDQPVWLPSSESKMLNGFAKIDNVRVRDYFGVLENDISSTHNLKLTGLGIIESGLVHTGSNGTDDKYVNMLYRTDSFSIRLSIAGYTEGTVKDRTGNIYKKWTGYIEKAEAPAGTVTIPESINSKVTDCALALDGITPVYNPQELYQANQVIPVINQRYADRTEYSNSGIYGNLDLSEPVFAPLRLSTDTQWGNKAFFEAVGNTSGAGSTLDKIEFHFYDNTPDYSTADTAAWLTEKGWVINSSSDSTNLYDSSYTYCADIIGGARQFDSNASQRTTGGLRYSTVDSAAYAFKYIDLQNNMAVPDKHFDTTENGIYTGAKASLFTGSAQKRRAADNPDGLYFGLGLTDLDLAITKSFTVSYDDTVGFITDLAGNRLRSATIKTIDRTPPSYDIILSPINQKDMYIVFVKNLVSKSELLKFRNNNGDQIDISERIENLLPKCFELISIDSIGNAYVNDKLQIDRSVPARIEHIQSNYNGQEFTAIRLSLNEPVTLPDIENLYIRIITPEGYDEFTHDPITGIPDSRVSFIQDATGNYLQMFEAHSLSDFAINAINTLYAYDDDMTYNSEVIMNGLYENGSWAVHDWNAEQQNYGTLPANHPYSIVSDIVTGTNNNEDLPAGVRIFLSNAPLSEAVSKQYNSDLNTDLRLWLPEITDGLLPALAIKNNPADRYYQTDSTLLNESDSLSRIHFSIPREISENWGSNQQISFLYGFTNADGTPLRIFNSPYLDVSTGLYDLSKSGNVPLYSVRLKDPADITSIDLWSFRTKATTEQRGGVTILNNVINVTNGEKTVVKVNLPSDGNLRVMVMTLDGNVVTYLNHGNTKAGEYYYSWDGRNNKNNPVARGMYFIRILGPSMDETRKVMVVK